MRHQTGNAVTDSAQYRGWLVGHFVDGSASPLRSTNDVEIKWGVHSAGETRSEWVRGEVRTCVVLLITGRFRVKFSDAVGDEVLLTKQGDYVIYGPNVDHRWIAEAESVVVTVRWPSVAPAD
jgi:phenolic acid decarboxylase